MQSDARPSGDLAVAGLFGGSVGCASGGGGLTPWVSNILLWRFDHEIFLWSFPSADSRRVVVSSGERMCTILVNRLEDLACPIKVWLGTLTTLDMTPLG